MSDHSPPNFVLLMVDQQRGDCLSIDEHAMPCVQTPNLDAMAASGVRFRRAYSTCPSCIAARRSLISGQHPASHGMVGMVDGVDWNPPATLPGELQKRGYQTAFIGRTMHWHPRWRRYGFEEMKLSVSLSRPEEPLSEYELSLQQATPDDPSGFGGHGLDWNGWNARPWHLSEPLHEVYWTVSQAIRWLQRRDPSRPFFLMISFFGPHPPLAPPAHYMERYLGMDLPQPTIGQWAAPPEPAEGLPVASDRVNLTGERLRQCQAGYFGLINYIDDQIGRLFSPRGGAPREALRDAVVLYTSDHGEMLGDHYLFRKTYPYEGSARIPLFIRGPGLTSRTVCPSPVCLEDLMPTVLDLAGCPIPPSVDGQSMAPVLRGESAEGARQILHGEHAVAYRPEQANHYLTDGRDKFIWFSQTGIEQLFDLENDPGERVNLAASQSERLGRWRQCLIEHLAGRPEGFTDGQKLIPGRPHRGLVAPPS
jgi:arylsulfatase A-like enzyme